MPDTADAEFVAHLQAARAGDQDAATTLFHRFGPAVRACLRKWLNGSMPGMRAVHDSEGLQQEVFMTFFTDVINAYQFHHPAQLGSFLRSMAHARFMDAHRKHLRQHFQSLFRRLQLDDRALDDHPLLVSREPSPSEGLMATEALQQLLNLLPDTHQRVVRLRVEGRTTAEIAVKLCISESRVRRILREVRSRG